MKPIKIVGLLLVFAIFSLSLSSAINVLTHKYMIAKTEKSLNTCFKEYSEQAKKFKKISCDGTICHVSMIDPDILSDKRKECQSIESDLLTYVNRYRSLPIRF